MTAEQRDVNLVHCHRNSGQPLEAGEETVISERPANAFRGAQPGERVRALPRRSNGKYLTAAR
ncbi:hypothetical protein ABID59_001280 [Bradyrhizobium sp. S3.3.6]|uniref:hypothetical protein n=1 Tax=Bradyrhizobium sp. S3.3.6 TaxID=3156429 RepID=UPI003394D56D